MDDFVVNVRQIGQYPQLTTVPPDARLLIQPGGAGKPYYSADAADLVSTCLLKGGFLQLSAGSGISWSGAVSLVYDGAFQFSDTVQVPDLYALNNIYVRGEEVATKNELMHLFNDNTVWSFNGRHGRVLLEEPDILRAGGAPINNPNFHGRVTAPEPWDTLVADSTVATTCWVQRLLRSGVLVNSFNGRTGCVVLTADDITAAASAPGAMPRAVTPPFGDASTRIATTMFVDEGLADLKAWTEDAIQQHPLTTYAPLDSPQFVGIPTAPTANPGTTTGQLATTAFVMNAVAASTAGVSSWNTRTGAVTLTLADVTGVGGAPIASPTFTGLPLAPTAATATSTTQLATTAFVHAVVAAVSAGVTTFNGRSGAVTLTTGDVTGAGGAPVASPALTGTPTAPTAAPATNTTQIATCAFVEAAIATVGAAVTSFNSRTGAVTLQASDVSAVGGALVNNPVFTGNPQAPTPAPGDNDTSIATTAFVQAAISATAAGVVSFNGRTGVVTMITADITGAGGAPIASPALTGTPTAPTAAQTVNDTTLATTAFVHAAITAGAGVTSFNTRTGPVTLSGADVSGAGGALLASPTFTGTPAAPTAAPGTSTTQLATCAFVAAATGNVVQTFNGRNGAVTLSTADVTGAGGAPIASPTFTGTPNAPTPTAGTNNTQVATTAYVQAAISALGAGFASGTVMLFYQAAAPTGWTQVTTHNDKALRVVSGAGGGSGGTNPFSTVMAQTTVGNHTLVVGEVPNLNATVSTSVFICTATAGWSSNTAQGTAFFVPVPGGSVGSIQSMSGATTNGGGGAHNHPITMAMQYIDIILASKN